MSSNDYRISTLDGEPNGPRPAAQQVLAAGRHGHGRPAAEHVGPASAKRQWR
jgi:hypothetical protein